MDSDIGKMMRHSAGRGGEGIPFLLERNITEILRYPTRGREQYCGC